MPSHSPSSTGSQALGRARAVLDVAVVVAVAEPVDPLERGQYARAVSNRLVVVGEAPVVGEQDQPQRRGVGGSVVRAVRRLLPEDCQLALAHLVQDLPRLRVAEVVDLTSLQLPEEVERACGSGPTRASEGR